jgi:two-component system sensor histidine kinase KdpD
MLLNYYFTPPLHTLTISETNNSLALLVFVLVAALVSSASTCGSAYPPGRSGSRRVPTLANLAGSVLVGEDGLAEMPAARAGGPSP